MAKLHNPYISGWTNILFIYRQSDGSRTPATSKIEFFVTLVNGWTSFSDVTQSSILDAAGVLVTPLSIWVLDKKIMGFIASIRISINIVPRAPKLHGHIYKNWLLNVFRNSSFPFENSYKKLHFGITQYSARAATERCSGQ